MRKVWLFGLIVLLCGSVYAQRYSSPFGGWCHYRDTTYSTTSRLTVNDGDTTALPNKGALSIINTYMLNGDSTFWDTTANKVIAWRVGESFQIRIDFMAEPQSASMAMTLALDIGGSQNHIVEQTMAFPRGAGNEHSISMGFPYYTLSTFVSNGGTIQVMPSGGNVEIWNVGIFISRDHKL